MVRVQARSRVLRPCIVALSVLASSAEAHPRRADATDVFAWTTEPGRLALALLLQPLSGRRARFDPEVSQRLVVRRATLQGTGPDLRVDVGDELQITCTSERGRKRADMVRCEAVGPTRTQVIEGRVDEVHGASTDPIRLFAGVRKDPFFIDIRKVDQPQPRDGARRLRGTDTLANGFIRSNDLAVVLEVDVATFFGDSAGLFAVAGEIELAGELQDRVGRPEITGFFLSKNWGPGIDGDDVRAPWNAERTFAIPPDRLALYRTTLVRGLDRLDGLDRFADPAARDPGPAAAPDWSAPPFLDLLLVDALLVDPGIACSVNTPSYFEVEMAAFRDRPADEDGRRHVTCGGRTPNPDVVDEILTLFINGPDRVPPGAPLYGPDGAFAPRRGDGVDRARAPATDAFPWFQGF